MKKGKAIGMGVGILAISIIVGIASLPDEVLTENSSNENFQTKQLTQLESNPIPDNLGESEISRDKAELLGQRKVQEEKTEIPEVESEVLDEQEETKTQGKKFEVKLSDGIGAGDR